jgi:hypothetical protein
LQNRLNRIFRQQLPPRVWKDTRDFNSAIDLSLIPYHAQPYQDQKEIVRSAPKAGTTPFHGCATVSIVQDHRRYVVALRFIEYGEEMADIVRWLLKRLKSLKFRIRRVFLDKGFCSKPVFEVLDQHKVSFVIPIPVRGKSGGARTGAGTHQKGGCGGIGPAPNNPYHASHRLPVHAGAVLILGIRQIAIQQDQQRSLEQPCPFRTAGLKLHPADRICYT